MFNRNKKDPLVDSVMSVMAQNNMRRTAEELLNESLGIDSKAALPHEYRADYDRALEEVLSQLNETSHEKKEKYVKVAKDDVIASKENERVAGLKGNIPDREHWKKRILKRKSGIKKALGEDRTETKSKKATDSDSKDSLEKLQEEIRQSLIRQLERLNEEDQVEKYNSLTEEQKELIEDWANDALFGKGPDSSILANAMNRTAMNNRPGAKWASSTRKAMPAVRPTTQAVRPRVPAVRPRVPTPNVQRPAAVRPAPAPTGAVRPTPSQPTTVPKPAPAITKAAPPPTNAPSSPTPAVVKPSPTAPPTAQKPMAPNPTAVLPAPLQTGSSQVTGLTPASPVPGRAAPAPTPAPAPTAPIPDVAPTLPPGNRRRSIPQGIFTPKPEIKESRPKMSLENLLREHKPGDIPHNGQIQESFESFLRKKLPEE